MTDKKNGLDSESVIKRFERFRDEANKADHQNRLKMVEDLKFSALDQWPDEVKAKRKNRVMLTLDKTAQGVKAVTGTMRDNRPSIKVTPVDSFSDPETAKVISGLIRQIEQQSGATAVYMDAANSQVKCGYGVWRVVNEFAANDVFEQDIFVRRVKNPLNWWFDPRALELTKSDGRYVIGISQMHKDEFKAEFGGKGGVDIADVDSMFTGEGFGDWIDDEDVIFGEMYEKVPKKKKLLLLSTGVTIDEEDLDENVKKLIELSEVKIVKERVVDSYEINYWKVTGNATFDHRVLPTQYFPVIPLYGEVDNIEGEEFIRGLIRPAIDPQRNYNYMVSSNTEVNVLQPIAPYIGTAKMFAGLEHIWNSLSTSLKSWVPFNVDKDAPGMRPERQQPPISSSGYLQASQVAEGDIKAAMGVHEASFGQESSADSGKAKLIEKQSGDTTNSIYLYNLGIAIEHTARVIVDMLPHYYDTMRIQRILGEDGTSEEVTLNRPFRSPEGEKIEHDLTRGKYDVRYSVGPSYKSQREQTVDMMFNWAQSDPRVLEIGGDIIADNLDAPFAQELAERLRKLLPPGMVEEKDPEKRQQIQQQEQAQQQEQQQQLQIQIKDLLSTIAERDSKTELNKAKTAETLEGIPLEKFKAVQDSLAKLASNTQNEANNDRRKPTGGNA
jgi:hypothetical protein